MKILGIDYGRKRLGMAIADSDLAEPYGVILINSPDEAVRKVAGVVEREKIDKIIMGNPGGEIGKEVQEIAPRITDSSNVKVILENEDYSTVEAQEMALNAGIPRRKRKALKDAYTATVILQRYLDKTG